jgi:hypothetical protein
MKQKELTLEEVLKLARKVDSWKMKEERTDYAGEYMRTYEGSYGKTLITFFNWHDPRPYEGYADLETLSVSYRGAKIGGYGHYHKEEEGENLDRGDKQVTSMYGIIAQSKEPKITKEKAIEHVRNLLK